MGCIEICLPGVNRVAGQPFNRNMGCIEILPYSSFVAFLLSLIETWDVLKSVSVNAFSLSINAFNRNMGCIEMKSENMNSRNSSAFNRNMGCIEINLTLTSPAALYRLIETWDVLKSVTSSGLSYSFSRLIETWDVLKLTLDASTVFPPLSFNRNMGCIEIH